jgi:two-component system sensor histidine kinase PilS (NtrC family)
MTPPGSIERCSIDSNQSNNPRLLRIYAGYRLCLSVLFVALIELQLLGNYLSQHNHRLFSIAMIGYFLTNLLAMALLYRRRWHPSETVVFAMLLVDTLAITLLIHASGDRDSALSYLLMVTVAASGVLQRSILALALAAIASFILISGALASLLSGSGSQTAVINSGIFGTLLFATAMVFIFLAKRLSLAQQLAITESRIALQLQRLNDLVINKMRTGIIVFDENYRIEQLNERASMLLGQIAEERLLSRDDNLNKIPELVAYHREWLANPRLQQPSYHAPLSNIPIQVSFSDVIGETQHDYILFLEDARTIAQHAQQLKNNSLGQLTASIAHEIRNPLGAISHAAQLLNESSLNGQQQHLVDVILRHGKRVNQLVQNVLQLSRQKTPKIEIVDINQHCLNSKVYIEESGEFSQPVIELDANKAPLEAPFDPSQLQQVITNLLTNALHHSQNKIGLPWARIVLAIEPNLGLPVLRVFDRGNGVAEQDIEKIFAPFFTTEKNGTGLGLYIARGLCEINFATLSYIYNRHRQGYFQIVFSDPAKQLPGKSIDG